MNDYFFIASPLHLLMAANVCLQHPDNEKVLVVISKSRPAGARFRAIAESFPNLFQRVVDVSGLPPRARHNRPSSFPLLRREFARPLEARLFTGNDRRIEFQYAMHTASAAGRRVEGVYLDEGMVTYIGHKSMHRWAHRYSDPVFKKLCYGFWYRNARTTGASGWIRTATVAFPDAVHPLLRTKRITAIDPAPFKTPPLKALAAAMLQGRIDDPGRLRGIKLLMALPHEGAYRNRPERVQDIGRRLLDRFQAEDMAVKPHPRITDRALVQRLFPGSLLLDHTVGIEALLPLLGDSCIVIGDISSALLTTRWLRPDLSVIAVPGPDPAPDTLLRLYATLGIPLVAPDRLPGWLAGRLPDKPHANAPGPGCGNAP